MNQVLTIVNTMMPDLITLVVSSGIVAALVQAAKKWLSLQSPKVIMVLTTTVSLAAGVIPYIISAAGQNPALLGPHTLAIVGGATVIYRFVVQPLSSFLSDYKDFKSNKNTTVNLPAGVAVTPAAAVSLSEAITPASTTATSTNEVIW